MTGKYFCTFFLYLEGDFSPIIFETKHLYCHHIYDGMNFILLALILIIPRLTLSQEFKSTVTAHPKSQFELEFIERDIKFYDDKITITSRGKELTDIQELFIQSIEQKEFEQLGLCTWFYTYKNLPGTEKIVIVPVNEKPEQIVIFEPVENAVNFREFRIVLD